MCELERDTACEQTPGQVARADANKDRLTCMNAKPCSQDTWDTHARRAQPCCSDMRARFMSAGCLVPGCAGAAL
eukprot:1455803-Heterocapsa_arctica.AAC.1